VIGVKEQPMASDSDAIFLKNCWYVAAWITS